MNGRPDKLPPSATLVVWGARRLVLSEKVVWYHDWALDQGGADGSYISVRSMSERLGGSLAPDTIKQARWRLKRLGLHESFRRPDCRNMGWVATLPAQCIAHRAKDGTSCAVLLDTYIVARETWLSQRPPDTPERDGQPYPRETASGTRSAAAFVGGLGGSLLSTSAESKLPSVVSHRQKGVGAIAPELEESGEETMEHLTEAERWERLRERKRAQCEELKREARG